MKDLPTYSNHFGLVIDESLSMRPHTQAVINVVDGLTQSLAKDSEDLNQETRLSVWAFNSRGTERNIVWDIDVLRMPSINGLYKPQGMTALIDCTILAISDLKKVPTMYGDHSVVLYIVTDGQENASRQRYSFNQHLDSLPDNWSLGLFVPDKHGVTEAKIWGFPADSIQVWNPAGPQAVENVGQILRDTSSQFMRARTTGVRGTKSLFQLNTVSVTDVKQNLTPLASYEYHFGNVLVDTRSDNYVVDRLGRPWVKGQVFYQLTKKEKIQSYKQIAIYADGRIYVGKNARDMLGLPSAQDVEVVPDNWSQYKIFVQSTAPNRKLIRGTQVLVMSNPSFALQGDPWKQ